MDTKDEITIYGTSWCSDTRRAVHLFDEHQIPYRWIDIDRDRVGEEFVISTNHGNRSVPTILFKDGSILVEPSNPELIARLG